MLIVKLFLPLASPGLGVIGMGLVGITSGTYNAIEVAAIVIGLLVVAVAGIFTIRSNVAKIWREQAEGEKARNVELTDRMAEMVKDHAEAKAQMLLEIAAHAAELKKCQDELVDANRRTNLDAVSALIANQHAETITALLAINETLAKRVI